MVTRRENDSTDDFTDSRARGFNREWPVAPAYQIIDGHVCPLVNGEWAQHGSYHPFAGCRRYLPMARPELPGELAKIASGADTDVLQFVRRYGLLGYAQAWRFEELIGSRYLALRAELARLEGRDDATIQQFLQGYGVSGCGKTVGIEELPVKPLRGDPLSWLLSHARTVKLVLELLGSLNEPVAIRAAIDRLTVRDAGNFLGIEFDHAQRGYLSPSHSRSIPAEPRTAALKIISQVLEANLTGVSRALQVEWQASTRMLGFSSIFQSQNLLDCVYWHLADAAIGGGVRRCANPRCAAFFVAKSQRIKYCPAPRGFYAESDEREPISPCMNRHKQQAHRDHQVAERRRRTAAGAKQQRPKSGTRKKKTP